MDMILPPEFVPAEEIEFVAEPLTEETLILEALHARVQMGKMTEDEKSMWLNKYIGKQVAVAQFDMLFYPVH
jgi:hypothetical protein